MLFMSCVCHAFASVHCCLVVTCWERADLLALVCDDVKLCFSTFQCGILGQVWYFIVSILDLYRISFFYQVCSNYATGAKMASPGGHMFYIGLYRENVKKCR